MNPGRTSAVRPCQYRTKTRAAVKAIEVTTGRVRWQHGGPPRRTYMEMSGLMSTAGKLIFGGDGEQFFAVDAETGAELWHFTTGAQIWVAPVTYEADWTPILSWLRPAVAFWPSLCRNRTRGGTPGLRALDCAGFLVHCVRRLDPNDKRIGAECETID